MRRRLLALVVGGVMAFAAMQVAFAAIPTSISARYDATAMHFKGRVSSDDPECVAGRVVRLFKKTVNGPELQGRDRTNTAGRWDIELMDARGKYFAWTPRAEAMDGFCASDRSRIVDVM